MRPIMLEIRLIKPGFASGEVKSSLNTRSCDYHRFDLLIGMDKANLRNMHRICGGDLNGKLHLLLEYAGRPNAESAPSARLHGR